MNGRGQRGRTRAFGHHLGVCEQQPHGVHHLIERGHAGAIDQLAHHRPQARHHRGAANALDEGVMRLDLHHLARGQRGRGGSGMFALRRENLHARIFRTDGRRHSHRQAAAADGREHPVGLREVFENFESDGAVAHDHARIGHGIDQQLRALGSRRFGDVAPPGFTADETHLAAQLAHAVDLGDRRIAHHVGRHRNAELLRRPRGAVGHVAGARHRHAVRQFLAIAVQQRRHRGAQLECADGLQRLQLEEDAAVLHPDGQLHQRRVADIGRDALTRGFDLGKRGALGLIHDHGVVSRFFSVVCARCGPGLVSALVYFNVYFFDAFFTFATVTVLAAGAFATFLAGFAVGTSWAC